MFTRLKAERDRENSPSTRRRKNARPPMLSLPRSNSIKILPTKNTRIEEETAKGVLWSITARRGRRRTHREDMYTALPFVSDASKEPISVFGVFDGHGGPRAAETASKRLPHIFLDTFRECGDVTQSLVHAFLVTDDEVIKESRNGGDVVSLKAVGRRGSLFSRRSRECSPPNRSPGRGLNKGVGLFEGALRKGKSRVEEVPGIKNVKECGCTATVVAMVGKTLCIAHVGDSGAVLSTKRGFHRLCEDHRPGRPDEQRRIESMGGLVLEISGTPRVNGVLAVSRSIGDAQFKDFVIAKPEVVQLCLKGDEEFLVVATDGLWDLLSDNEAMEIVKTGLSGDNGEEVASKKLVEVAWERGGTDDICVLVINLCKYAQLFESLVDDSEFLTPVEGESVRGRNFRDRVLNDPQLPVSVELVTPHAEVAPTPRVRKNNAW